MSKAEAHQIIKKPTGKPVFRKSSVDVPTIGISPSTKRLMEENERIVSTYGKNSRGGRFVEVVVVNK